VLLIGSAATVSNSRGAQLETASTESLEERLENQGKRLEDIQAFVAQQREAIEHSYAFQVGAVLERKEAYLRRLSRSVANLSQGDRRMLSGLLKVYSYEGAIDCDQEATGYVLGVGERRTRHNGALEELLPIVEIYVSGPTAMEATASKLLRDMEEFQMELTYLQERRDASLEELARWEHGIREDVIKTIDQIQAPARETDIGVIKAIMHEKDHACIMINEDIVYQGSTTRGVKVLRIYKDRVEFSKRGRKWAQKLGAPAGPYWNQ
jgi:hypothetical protein